MWDIVNDKRIGNFDFINVFDKGFVFIRYGNMVVGMNGFVWYEKV